MQRPEIITLTLTPAAMAHVREMIQKRGKGLGLRITMKKYGCNGFGYVPEIVDAVKHSDIEIIAITPLRVFIDAAFATELNGTVVDYAVKGLGQSQLLFRNPNAEGECGCGE